MANAYLYSHGLKRHNDAGVLRRMPVPSLTDAGVATVTTAARDYLDCVTPDSAQPGSRFVPERAAHLLLRVDAAVLTLYNMPVNIERQLLDYFRDSPREGVPFSFNRYYPGAMDLPIRLHTFLAITEDWPQMNERRGVLIRRKAAGTISQEEIAELKQLQGLATTRRRLVAPLPLQQLEHLRQDLVSK